MFKPLDAGASTRLLGDSDRYHSSGSGSDSLRSSSSGSSSPDVLPFEAEQDPLHAEYAERAMAGSVALVLSGRALTALLAEEDGAPETQARPLELAAACSVVPASRASSKQEALVVRMVDSAAPGAK
jgi:hypothetical protein